MKDLKFDIQRFAEVINLTSGNDNFTITGSDKIVYAKDGHDFIYKKDSDSNITINCGDGADTVKIGNYYGTNNVSVAGGAGNDSIYNYSGDNWTVSGDDGNDNIRNNFGQNISINGGAGSDNISNSSGANATINGGDGNDNIENYGDYANIEGGSGNDSITSRGGINVSIFGGDGADELENRGKNGLIDGGYGDDLIKSYYGSDNTTLIGGKGNDKIDIGTAAVMIRYIRGDGNDSISGFNEDDTLKIAASSFSTLISGNDVIVNVGSNQITLKSANYDLVSRGKRLNIVYDENVNTKDHTVISGTGGNDSIYSDNVDYVTIYAGDGADTVTGNYYNSKIYSGSGNDSINVVDTDVYRWEYALMVSKYTNLRSIFGDDFANTIDGGEGDDTINIVDFNAASINGGNGDDKISLSGDNPFTPHRTVKGGKGNDIIYGIGDERSVGETQGYQGFSKSGTYYEYSYGDGNDTIYNFHSKDTISIGGSSSYTTLTSSDNVIVSIIGSGSITLYNDTCNSTKNKKVNIIGGKYEEHLDITTGGGLGGETLGGGAEYSISGGILTVFENFKGSKIDLSDYTGATKVNAAALSKAVSIVGTAAANSLKGGNGNDTIYGGSGNDTVSLGGGKDIYIYSSGNDLIQDYTAGADKIKLSSGSITDSSISGSNVILKTSNGNITIQNGKDQKITIIDKDGKETTQIYPLVTPETLSSGWKYGNTAKTNLTASVASAANVDLTQTYGTSVVTVDGSKITAARSFTGNALANSIKGGTGADTISGNAGNDSLYGGNGNDKIYGGNDNDKLFGDAGNDSLYGGIGNDTLTGGKGNDIFIYEDGNDIITDYTAGQDKIKFSVAITNNSISGNNVIFKTASGNVTVQNGKGKKITTIDKDGKETTQIYPTVTPDPISTFPNGWKYGNTAKTNLTASIASAGNIDLTQSYGTSVVTVDGSKATKNISLTGNAKANSINGGKGADTISGNAGNDSLYGGNGNDKIYGGNDNDKLFGDAGNDSLYGGSGNDTLTGGKGNDIFIYEGGNDIITDYNSAGQDKIKLSDVSISSASLSGNNVILKTSKGNITVQNTKNKNITVIDKDGKETKKVYSETTPLPSGWKYGTSASTNNTASIITATLASSENIDLTKDYGKNVTKVDGTNITKAVSITGKATADSLNGGSGADTLTGGKGNDTIYGNAGNDKISGDAGADKLFGDAGNDSLYGGLGNDTLTGGDGNDVFIYEGGKDVITDYTAGQDKIKISSGKISKTSYSGNNVIFKIGSGTLTVQKAKGQNISVTDSSGTKTYSKTLDLMYDDNFVTDEFELDSITEEKVDVTEIQNTNTETFAQDENILTYSEDK